MLEKEEGLEKKITMPQRGEEGGQSHVCPLSINSFNPFTFHILAICSSARICLASTAGSIENLPDPSVHVVLPD